MEHKYYKILIEKKINGTITKSEIEILNKHLNTCMECKRDLEEVEKMNLILDNHAYKAPEDNLWNDYKSNIYARIERSVGWIFFSAGFTLILIAGVFYFIRNFLMDYSVPLIIRLGTALLVMGVIILLISIIRERLFFNKNERYKEVKK